MSLIPNFELGIWNAWLFMIWLVILPFLTNLIIKDKDTSNKLKISAPVKFEKELNIMSMIVVIFAFIYSIFLPFEIETIWFYIGIVFFIIGFVIYISTLGYLRDVTANEFFNKGPYRFSRHPVYVSMVFIFVSVIIACVSWVFLILLIFLLIHLIIAAPAEEQYCLKKYGKDYQQYIESTPRWIGLPKSFKK